MKKAFLFSAVVLLSIQASHAQLKSKVDERFELTSIVFTLAGVPEYCQCAIPSYREDIHVELTPYELSEPIHYIRVLNQAHRVAYAAVSSTAAMLEIVDGEIRLQPRYDMSDIPKADSRWTEELFSKYIEMLNVFYKESNFHKFFEDHRELYALAEERMDKLLADTETGWFSSFFGRPIDSQMNVYVSLANGPHNYAVPDGILVGMMGDKEGLPDPNTTNTMFVLIHELGHHYTNPLFDEWWPQMKEAAERIYPHVEKQMWEIAYSGAYTTFCEWMNNLFVLSYMKDTGNVWLDHFIARYINQGFIWMRRGMDFMENFYAHRNLYPHIDDFMPQMVAFVNYTADNFDLVLREYETRRPYITNVYPAVGSDITGFDEIVITFSEPMLGAYGFQGSGDEENLECLYLNENVSFEDLVKWSDDMTQATILLDKEEAKENTAYGIQLSSRGFVSARYFQLDEKSAKLTFNTAGE